MLPEKHLGCWGAERQKKNLREIQIHRGANKGGGTDVPARRKPGEVGIKVMPPYRITVITEKIPLLTLGRRGDRFSSTANHLMKKEERKTQSRCKRLP